MEGVVLSPAAPPPWSACCCSGGAGGGGREGIPRREGECCTGARIQRLRGMEVGGSTAARAPGAASSTGRLAVRGRLPSACPGVRRARCVEGHSSATVLPSVEL